MSVLLRVLLLPVALAGCDTVDAPGDADARVWKYTLHTKIVTTMFWCGEAASKDNGYISNTSSAWDGDWKDHFGGEDDPDDRKGYLPASFTPKENPFYFALPYNDFDHQGERKVSASSVIYWASGKSYGPKESMVKNRWIQVTFQAKTCYGQWEDVGPYHEDDQAYVFGSAPPKNTTSPKAGLDLSPALRDCLGMGDTAQTSWRFVDDAEVPAGPWKTRITVSNTLQ